MVMNSALSKKPIIRNDQHQKQKYFFSCFIMVQEMKKAKAKQNEK